MLVGCPDKFCVLLVSLTYVQLYTGYWFPLTGWKRVYLFIFLNLFYTAFFVRSYLNLIAQKSNEKKP